MANSAIADTPVLMTMRASARWNGIGLDHWWAAPGEMPEQTYADHEINIPLAGTFTTIKQTAVGKSDRRDRGAPLICIVPSGQPIEAQWRNQVECVTLSLKPSWLARVSGKADLPERVELVEVLETEDHLIRQIGLALLAEAVAPAPQGRLYAESLANALAMHLIRRYSVRPQTLPSFRGGLSGHKLHRVKEFIEEHLGAELTLAHVATSAGLSQFHFARAFKRTTGLTPQQYVTERRVDLSKRLLEAGELPLVDVAARAGFKNQSHFTTVFRRVTGMTPKTWRDESPAARGSKAFLL